MRLPLFERTLQLLFHVLPTENAELYRVCRHYVDRYNGDNNDNMTSNGEARFLRQVLGACQTVFDVGANIGDWTALALEINPRLQVHCFEPLPTTYAELQGRSFPAQVVRNDFGLGSKAEQRSLLVYDHSSGMNTLFQRKGLEAGWGISTPHKAEAVWLDTVDAYCARRNIAQVDLMKLDVEGNELEVLRGAGTMLSEGRVGMVQFEYGGCNIDSGVLLKDFFEYALPLGYVPHKIMPDRLKRVERYDQRLENFTYQNWVLVRGV